MPAEIPGFLFPVLASPGAEASAISVAHRIERAMAWMSAVFGFEPRPRLEVLDPVDWAERAVVDMYGMPHFGEDGAIYIAASDADLFADLVRLTLDDMPGALRPGFLLAYGDPPNVRSFADLLSLHELAHLYHAQAGFEFGRWWLRELFCNIALQGYVVEAEPESRVALETFSLAAQRIKASRMACSAIDDMGDADGVNYGWYELRLHAAAIDIWRDGGRSAVIDLYERARAAAVARRPIALDQVHPAIAHVATTWPGRP